jgi:hypothetical protein
MAPLGCAVTLPLEADYLGPFSCSDLTDNVPVNQGDLVQVEFSVQLTGVNMNVLNVSFEKQ